MSAREDNVRESCGLGTGEGKCTRDNSQLSVGGATRTPAAPALRDKAVAQLRRAALVLPRGPQPGKPWTPRTDAEQIGPDPHALAVARALTP